MRLSAVNTALRASPSLFAIPLDPDQPCPSIHSSVISEFGFCSSVQCLETALKNIPQTLWPWGQELVGMYGGKDEDVLFYVSRSCESAGVTTDGSGKDHQIHEDQRQRHNRPAPSRHLLVLDWDNHARGRTQTCFARCRGLNVTEQSQSSEMPASTPVASFSSTYPNPIERP